jgi:hypothetical protein
VHGEPENRSSQLQRRGRLGPGWATPRIDSSPERWHDFDEGRAELRPRVLVVNKFLHHVGGVETYMKWLSANLDAEGYDVAFLGMPPPTGTAEMLLEGPSFHTPFRDYHGRAAVKIRSAADLPFSGGSVRTPSGSLPEHVLPADLERHPSVRSARPAFPDDRP